MRSQKFDPRRQEELQRIVNTVAEGFNSPLEADGLSDRLAPLKFIQRQALILNADKELNELQVRESQSEVPDVQL
jgi:hypothetical protein